MKQILMKILMKIVNKQRLFDTPRIRHKPFSNKI